MVPTVRVKPALVFVLTNIAGVKVITLTPSAFNPAMAGADDIELWHWNKVDIGATPEEIFSTPFRRLPQETDRAATAGGRTREAKR